LIKLVRSAPRDAERIEHAIDQLAGNPRPPGATKLQSRLPIWRIRLGSYRVIYSVFDPEELIVVGRIERRGERTYDDVGALFQ